MTALRVLICEDSPVYAAALRRMLEYEHDITVAGVCATAEEAMAALPRLLPQLVTMDIELPGMDGLAAVEQIMNAMPVPILVLSGHVAGASGTKTAAALAVGALDAVAKSDLDLRDPGAVAGAAFRRRIKMLSRATVIRHLAARAERGDRPVAHGRRASVIGMCASTGGPHVLAGLLGALPADYQVPILIAQHIGAGFAAGLASWLDQIVPMPVALAADGVPAGSGAWVAPDRAHLRLTNAGLLSVDTRTVAGAYRPSADALLESIAATARSAGVAVVLTGMGADGAAGAAAVRARGGLVLAQDEASSAVFGMPRAAIERGAELVLAPGEIASFLRGLSCQPLRSTR